MEYLKDLSLICIPIAGVSLLFKFFLDAISHRLDRLETSWQTQTDRLVGRIESLDKKYENHLEAHHGIIC